MILKVTKTHYRTISDAWCKWTYEPMSKPDAPQYWTGSGLSTLSDAVQSSSNPQKHYECSINAMNKALNHYKTGGYSVDLIKNT